VHPVVEAVRDGRVGVLRNNNISKKST
jgi:hypothetical protein